MRTLSPHSCARRGSRALASEARPRSFRHSAATMSLPRPTVETSRIRKLQHENHPDLKLLSLQAGQPRRCTPDAAVVELLEGEAKATATMSSVRRNR